MSSAAERRLDPTAPPVARPVRDSEQALAQQEGETSSPQSARPPLYPRLLRLQHVHPNAWQRALLGEGMAGLGLLLAMADLASAWSVLVLPVAVAGVVKAHDVLAGVLAGPASLPRTDPPPD